MLFRSLLIIIYSLRKRVYNFVEFAMRMTPMRIASQAWSSLCYRSIKFGWCPSWRQVALWVSRQPIGLLCEECLSISLFFFSFIKFYYGTLYNVYLCTCFPEWLHSKTKSLNRTSNPSIWDNAPSFRKNMPSLWFNDCLAVGCSQNMGCNLPQWGWWCILQWHVVLYWLVCWVSKEGINNWRPFLKVKSNLWNASDLQIQLFMILKQREQKWWHHKNQICEIMRMLGISSKNKMKNVHLPSLRISLFVQIGKEIYIVRNVML